MIDPKQLRSTRTVVHTSGLFCGTYEPATGRFLAGTIDGQIIGWSGPEYNDPRPFRWQHSSYVFAIGPIPGERMVVSAGFDRRIVWWDPVEGNPLRELRLEARPLQLSVSSDDRYIAIVDDERWLHVIECKSGRTIAVHGGHPQYTPKMHPSSVYAVTFSPNAELVATADRTGLVLVRETQSGRIVHTLSATRFYSDFRKNPDGTPSDGEYELGGVRMLLFSPDGKTLIAGGMADYDPNSAATDGKMGLVGFDMTTGQEIFACVLPNDKGYLQTGQFHPSGILYAAGGGGTAGASGVGTLCAIDIHKPQDPVVYSLEMTVRTLALSADGTQVILGGMLKTAGAGQFEVWG